MNDPQSLPLRSAGSEMFGLLLLVPAIVVVCYLLGALSRKTSLVMADLLPEGAPSPLVTRMTFDFPFIVVGSVLALLVLVFAFILRKKFWVQRHLLLLVSIAWFGLGCFGLLTLAGLALPLIDITTGIL